MEFVIIALIVVILLMLVSNIKIVPQAYACIVERFGAYSATWNVGLHFKVPLFEKNATLLRYSMPTAGPSTRW